MKLRAQLVVMAIPVALVIGVSAFVATAQETVAKARKVVKSDAEWRKELPRDSYLVTRQAETEPAFSGKLVKNHAKGTYECICCSTPLFSSKTKFESGTGWPSFYAPVVAANVDTSTDYKLGYARTEVACNTCGAHLGHVFNDGPQPTGLRYCMNSVALKFVKDEPAPAKTAKPKTEAEKKGEAVEKKGENVEKKDTTPPTEIPKATM